MGPTRSSPSRSRRSVSDSSSTASVSWSCAALGVRWRDEKNIVKVESKSLPISAPVAYVRRASDAPKRAKKKFSVMKKTAETPRMRKKPSRPTTPAPAAFLLTASRL